MNPKNKEEQEEEGLDEKPFIRMWLIISGTLLTLLVGFISLVIIVNKYLS